MKFEIRNFEILGFKISDQLLMKIHTDMNQKPKFQANQKKKYREIPTLALLKFTC